MTLKDLKPGQSGTVLGWSDETPPTRFLEMGMLPGARIDVIRYAPFGDPMEIRVYGSHLSLRKEEAGRILVEPSD